MMIKLTKEEIRFLKETLLKERKDLINIFSNETNIISLDEKTADEIRDWALEKQQIVGFDKNYDLTKEGLIFDSLIEKFFS